MSEYLWLGLIALVAATLKGYILYKAVSKTQLQAAFAILSITLIIQNALEFVGSIAVANEAGNVDVYVHLVIATLYCMMLSLLYFGVVSTQRRFHGPLVFKFFSAWCALVAALHASGLLIEEFQYTAYSIISVPGEFYAVFLGFMAGGGLATTTILVLGARSQQSELSERSVVALKALSPVVAVILGVIIFRLLGFQSSTVIALPIASTIFLWVLMMDQRGEFIRFERSLLDQWTVFVIKWRTLAHLASLKSINPHQWRDTMEKSLVQSAMDKKRGIQGAADLLGIKRTTLSSKVEKHFGRSRQSAERKNERPGGVEPAVQNSERIQSE